jgi:hypothetical protein
VDHVAGGVTEDLHLDVPGVAQVALDQQRVVAEGAARLTPGPGDLLGQVGGVAHHPHALAAAAGAGLEQHREADLDRGPGDRVVVHARLGAAGDDRHTRGGDGLLGADLVAHRLDRGDRWPDEDDPGLLAGPGEVDVLGQEAVAGVHGLRAGAAGGVQHPVDRQVALRGRRGADRDGDVGEPGVQRAGVGVAVHGDRADAQRAERADDPDGDLAAVGDQDGVEHGSAPPANGRRPRLFAMDRGGLFAEGRAEGGVRPPCGCSSRAPGRPWRP